MQQFQQTAPSQLVRGDGCVEPSAAHGILAERFCCGPPLTPQQLQQPYYASELGQVRSTELGVRAHRARCRGRCKGVSTTTHTYPAAAACCRLLPLLQVFFPPDAWPPPQVVPELQGAMQACYRQFEAVTHAVLRLFAAALGLPADVLTSAFERHHSNMQVRHVACSHTAVCCKRCWQALLHAAKRCCVQPSCLCTHVPLLSSLLPLHSSHHPTKVANYPSQLQQTDELRKKAHADSGALTLLASEDWLPGTTWRPGDGGLQLLNAAGRWVEVAVPEGAFDAGRAGESTCTGCWHGCLYTVAHVLRASPMNQMQRVAPHAVLCASQVRCC